ncbi:uncharacterized protein LOC107479238 isoform X1 [Arachis duranensis]|uniref:Uncharacterized protein LOC107479238 isoform X1 n=1 Tax=Arachis duranensis TaxID=130453 RepID=A0A6P4CQ58_ARADU|nr:uncharacterized protein LOC107479238 isoform X1 [Arachis duranensis]XP_015954870.1 uncharacterized protein LOC107479238 isoform X1 [Arachis duranensis]XP_020994073.1 uncharacterized protein LOC107479238 isoform X1 [Arachis duranensis]
MLSLMEFCIALYLMEQHTEGRALLGVFPSNILLALLPSGLPATQYSSVTWGNPSGFQQEEEMSDPGAQRVNPTTGQPPRPASVFLSDEGLQKQQKSHVPVLEKHVINQLRSDEQNSINSKFQEASEVDKKTHADCIQSDLDELVKSLNNQCKKYGLRAKSTTLVELW